MNIHIKRFILPLTLLYCISTQHALAASGYILKKLVDTNAHEGPVFVKKQNRLYFTTKPNLGSKTPDTAIHYLDLSTNQVVPFIKHANMANGMFLTPDGNNLLVAEQGTHSSAGVISKINLQTKKRTILISQYNNKPFNSPNKVIQSSQGWIYFSDPHYGFNQGFKPKPQLPQSLYAFNLYNQSLSVLHGHFTLPHGLALSHNNKLLYISDTAAIDGRLPYNANKTKDILVARLQTPNTLANIESILQVPVGIPDGFIVTKTGEIWVAAGDGVRHYSSNGTLIKLIPIPQGAVNLTRGNNGLYITADTAIYYLSMPVDKTAT